MIAPILVLLLAFVAPLLAASAGITSAPSIAVSIDATSAILFASVVETTATPVTASAVVTSPIPSKLTASTLATSLTSGVSSVTSMSASLLAVGAKDTSTSFAVESIGAPVGFVAAAGRIMPAVPDLPAPAMALEAYEQRVSDFHDVVVAISGNTAPASFQRVTTTIVHDHTTTVIAQGVPPSHPPHERPVEPTGGPVPAPAPAPVNPGSPGYMTLSVINKYGPGLSMAHTSNVGAPTAVGDPKPTTLGSTAQYLYPTLWAGLLDIAPILDRSASKIEMSNEKGVFVDVSYVDGYTVPITCACAGKTMAGCNVELFNATGPCPDQGPGPICYNPSSFLDFGPTHPFFAPCEKASYTYPKDDLATRQCDGTLITCCVGSSCEPNPRQPGELAKAALLAKRARGFSGRRSGRSG